MGRVARWSVVAGVTGVALLAGCSGADDPVASPTPSTSSSSASPSPTTSPSPSPSPSDTGPTIPAAAREQTPAGAEAFVKYFFTQFNVAWTEPRPGLIKSLSDPQCQFCQKAESAATDLAGHGERYASDPVSLKTVDAFGGAPKGQQFVAIRHVQNAVKVVNGTGSVVTSDPRAENDFYVTLRWKGDRWTLLEMERHMKRSAKGVAAVVVGLIQTVAVLPAHHRPDHVTAGGIASDSGTRVTLSGSELRSLEASYFKNAVAQGPLPRLSRCLCLWGYWAGRWKPGRFVSPVMGAVPHRIRWRRGPSRRGVSPDGRARWDAGCGAAGGVGASGVDLLARAGAG